MQQVGLEISPHRRAELRRPFGCVVVESFPLLFLYLLRNNYVCFILSLLLYTFTFLFCLSNISMNWQYYILIVIRLPSSSSVSSASASIPLASRRASWFMITQMGIQFERMTVAEIDQQAGGHEGHSLFCSFRWFKY